MARAIKKLKLTEISDTDLKDQTFIKQGAEGRVYKTEYLGKIAIVKERFNKKYRHPQLNEILTKERISAEVKGLTKCKTLGIRTPSIYAVNSSKNQIIMEFISGKTIKEILYILEKNIDKNDNFSDEENEEDDDEEEEDADTEDVDGDVEMKCEEKNKDKVLNNKNNEKTKSLNMKLFDEKIFLSKQEIIEVEKIIQNLKFENDKNEKLSKDRICNVIKYLGLQIGKILCILHTNNIIHGDLTTSNMIYTDEQITTNQNQDNINSTNQNSELNISTNQNSELNISTDQNLDLNILTNQNEDSSFINKLELRICLLDLGLSCIKNNIEDKSVDLYVMKRCLISSHNIFYSRLYQAILYEYRETNCKLYESVYGNLQQVEMRGRKRSMIG